MLFVVSGRATPDVAGESDRISKEFQAEIVRMLASVQMTSPLTGIVLFPAILSPDIASMSDDVTYKRSDGSVFVALGISHAKWMTALPAERIDLMADSIRASVRRIKNTRLLQDDRTKLLEFVEQARITLKRAARIKANQQDAGGASHDVNR
jgi:hypothetical protein